MLARIAAGEGMGLLPASFAAVRREGVVFISIQERNLLRIRLGVAAAFGNAEGIDELVEKLGEALPPSL